jgi:hypothetical protein
MQHINATNELKSSEERLKEAKQENKRLNYELEYASTSTSSSSSSKWVQEKASFEEKVEQLQASLTKAESALEKEKSRGSSSNFGFGGDEVSLILRGFNFSALILDSFCSDRNKLL